MGTGEAKFADAAQDCAPTKIAVESCDAFFALKTFRKISGAFSALRIATCNPFIFAFDCSSVRAEHTEEIKIAAPFVAPALIAIPLFASTNADDLVLLTVFFANPRARMIHIVTGQLIGISALTFASILAAKLAVQLPESWIPFLGLVPLAMGVRQLLSTSEDDDETSAPPAGWWAVATVTIANGGDNLGAYIPVFATQSLLGVVVISVTFGLLTIAWCRLAHWIVCHPKAGGTIRLWTTRAAPYVLIAVGLWILAKHPLAAGIVVR